MTKTRRRSIAPLVLGFVMLLPAAAAAAADELPPPVEERFYQNVEWSPDGQWIAYSEFAGGEYAPDKWSIQISRRDGTGRRLLAPNALWAVWSPDGKRLAFESRRAGSADVYTVDADGANATRLTDHPSRDGTPAWSPTGERIAFSSDRGGNADIYVMSINGSRVRRLTEDPADDYNPSWSPDGQRIVFFRDKGDEADQVWVVEADGPREWNVTDDESHNIFPCYLPAGGIGFSSKPPGGIPRLITLNEDGTHRRTIGAMGAFFARWSPDGATVAFVAGRWPKAAIYVVRFDGVGAHKIIN